jgi:hypothetical protein
MIGKGVESTTYCVSLDRSRASLRAITNDEYQYQNTMSPAKCGQSNPQACMLHVLRVED